MVAIPRLRIKFGPVKTFQKVPDTKIAGNAKLIEKSFGEDVTKAENQSRKRGPNELEEVQAANKKQKLDRFLSSQCLTLLKLLMDQEYGWFFNEPVDPVKLEIPDYFSVVSKPMDLGTVKSRLLKNAYSGADEFAADVRLTFDNAMLYNPPGHFVYNTAKKSKEIFEVRWGSLEKRKKLSKLSVSEVDCTRQRSTETAASSGRFELPKPVKEKSEKVSLLLKPVKGESKKDTPVVTPKALATKLRVKKLEQGLGMSSTVKIPSKGSGLNGSCKWGSCGRITCVCLKSCNSSGSEVSSLTDCLVKNTSGSQATESEPQSNGSVSSRNEKNGCVSSQRDNELKTTLPAMPPLPPEKALRAAILKGQFAETILRAKHRKVLDQNNNKADLIRIQIEKEQMERAQREEKARIVAEMRAAEIARRMRAETELRQKRERQRLELEMMRKTFDFEENNFLILDKDLVKICGSSNLTRTMLLELGLLLRKDDCVEEMDSEIPDAMRIEDLEEGEIF